MSRHGPAIVLVVSGILLMLVSPSPAEDVKPPAPEKINRAIDAGVAWLKAKQRPDGGWGPCVASRSYGGTSGGKCYETGPTSFTVFTLAVCGSVKKSDRIVQKALKWLRKFGREHRHATYESASLILMLTALNEPATSSKRKDRAGSRPRTRNRYIRPERSRFTNKEWRWMGRHAEWLAMFDGGYSYWGTERADVSATQFAILGLRAASRSGYPVEHVGMPWDGAVAYLLGLQDVNGGFPYADRKPWSTGMTAAGLSTLLICREQMALLKREPSRGLDTAIEKAFAHLGKHFDPGENRSFDGRYNYYHYCHLYAVERVGMLSGRREIGGKDWYIRGAKWLLEEQKEDGSWVDRTCMKPKDILGTCFALLFLKRATPPAVTPSAD